MQCLTPMCDYINIIRLILKLLLVAYKGAKHDSEARLSINEMANPTNVKFFKFVQRS
jgi:hypothetical protein